MSKREIIGMGNLSAAAHRSRHQCNEIVHQFDDNSIINTDQTGCEYQSTYNRTLASTGTKSVFVQY